MSVLTWQRDSHELFDYESRNLVRNTFAFIKSKRFLRKGLDIASIDDSIADSILPTSAASEGPLDYLLSAIALDGRYLIQPAEKQPIGNNILAKKLWLVVKDLGQYTLSEGDVIKLGRFKLRVKMTCCTPVDEIVRPDLGLDGGTLGFVAPPSADGMACRICLLDGNGRDDDPIIEACACRGSIQYVHMGCLRYWINGRLSLSESTKFTYLFSQLSCELCKSPYPTQVQLHDGSSVPLVPLPETKAPFIVLENMMRAEGNVQSGSGAAAEAARGLYVISLAGKKILRLGRGHESDVRIADVSISRWHATVSFTEDGRFVLEDNNSKFGTLVAMRKPRLLDLTRDTTPLVVQAGRTVFKFMSAAQARALAAEEGRQPPQISAEE